MSVSSTGPAPSWNPGRIQKWLQLRTRLSGRLWTTFAIIMGLMAVFHIPWIFPSGLELNLTVGEYSHFRIPVNNALLRTHLASVLPAGALAITQFAPRIRVRAMNFHRSAGKVINVLTFISTLSAWGIARVSFGGDPSIQGATYVLGAMTLWATVKSWTAIRRLQIDEHRAWLIRAWSYQMSVLTLRALAVLSAILISIVGGFYHAIPCDEVEYILNDPGTFAHDYSQCQANWTGPSVTHVAVRADIMSGEELAGTAAIRAVFGLSTWGGLWIHAILCEYYLYYTRDESDRLKLISEKRQKAYQTLQESQSGRG